MKSKRTLVSIVVGIVFILVAVAQRSNRPDVISSLVEPSLPVGSTPVPMPELVRGSAELAVPFVKNEGQYADQSVKYAAYIFQGAVFVKENSVIYSLLVPTVESGNKSREHVQERRADSYEAAMAVRDIPRASAKVVAFDVRYGANSTLQVRGKDSAKVVVSDFRGADLKLWKQGLTSYETLDLGEPWNKIALELRAHEKNVEQLFYVQPGGKPEEIALNFSGIEGLSVDEQGELVIGFAGGKFALTKPVAYQAQADGSKREVPVEYALLDKQTASFKVGAYDHEQVLLIDPLLASTYLGGTNEEHFAYEGFGGHIYAGDRSIARDASGNVYVLSETLSNNFPTTAGVYDTTYNDSSSYLKNDVTISKFSSGLDTLLASTYLGGTSEDNASALALDAAGNVYITGFTRSMDFPVVNGNHDITFNGGPSDVFVSKLSGDLTQLLGSTFLGGRKTDASYSLLLDASGYLYVAGDTSSDNFPMRAGGYQSAVAGGTDGFIAKFTTDLTALSKVTLVGGTGDDYIRSLIRMNSGEIYVVGSSSSANYPTTAGVYDLSQNGKFDVVVSAFDQNLGTLIASTFLGQSYDDIGYALAANSAGDIVVSGVTESPSFPTTVGAYDQSQNGTYDAFVSKLSSNLHTLKESTFLGGANWEDVYAIGIDNVDQVFIAGSTRSSNYPITLDAYKRTLGGNSDGFITKLSANLATAQASTYMGGSGQLDAVISFVFDGAGDLATLGVTNSADFPITPGAYDSSSNGVRDLVVFRITKDLLSDTSSNHMEVSDSLGNKNIAVVAGSSSQITVKVFDQFGNVLPSYNGDYSVIFSGPGIATYANGPTCTNKVGTAIAFGVATTLTFNKGVASCTMKVYRAESVSVDVSISSTVRSDDNVNYDLDLTVSPGALSAAGSMLSVNPPSGIVTVQETLTLETRDFYGNPLGAASVGQAVNFNIGGANPQTIGGTDLGTGSYSAVYTPTNSGYDNITATLNASGVGSDSEGTRDGTYHLTVDALGLDHLEVRYESPPGTYNTSANMQANLSYSVAILARDALGNNVVNYDGWKSITLSGPAPAPYSGVATCTDLWAIARNVGTGMTLNFVDGKATCAYVPRKNEVTSLDATDGYVNSYGAATYDLDTNVSPDTVSHLTITGAATQVAGVPQLVTVRAKDQFGNVHVTYNGDRFLTFSGVSASYNGTVATVRDKTNAVIAFGTQATITFAAGVATTNIALNTRGSWSVDVTDGTSNSFASADYDLDVAVSSTGTVVAGESTIGSNSNPVGSCGVVVPIIIARDLYGNQLEAGGATVVATVAGGNAGTPSVVDNLDGSYFAGYTPSTSGSDSITGTINGGAIGKDLDGTSNGTFVQIVNPEAMNTATWVGTVSTAWSVPGNWQGGVVPTSCYDVIINGSYANPPTIDHAVSGRVVVRNLTIGSSAISVLSVSNAGSTNYLQVRGDLTIGGSGMLTHTANGVTVPHNLWVLVDGNMTISVGGKVDVIGRGYSAAGSGPGGSAGNNQAGWYFGGTHAGIGGAMGGGALTASQNTYGSISQPTTHGSSGGSISSGGSGGGVVRLIVRGILLNSGQITASGSDASLYASAGGAGGSIWLDVGAFQGNGVVSANGGLGNGVLSSGGGGGRVALYFTTNSYVGTTQAYGAGPNSYGGAGTIYLKDKGSTNGLLMVRNNSHNGPATRGVIGDCYTFDQIDIDSGGYYSLVSNQFFTTTQSSLSLVGGTLYLESGSSFSAPNATSILGAGGVVNIQAGGRFVASEVTSLANVSLYNYDRMSFPNLASMSSIRLENYGIYNNSSSTLTVNNSSTWVESGSLLAIGDTQPITDIIVESATLEFRNQNISRAAIFNTLEVRSGGVLTHTAASATPSATLNLRLTTLTIQVGGRIDATGRGYSAAGIGPGGPGSDSQAGWYFGGTHGGIGGALGGGALTASQNTYGSISQPTTHGSSGGSTTNGGSGGGVVRLIVSGVLLNSGQIIASGNDAASNTNGGGAGGSIWLDVGTFQGSGAVSASGGLGNGVLSGGGGGGRVALYFTTNSYVGNIHAYGAGPNSYGGAGTIYLKDNGSTYGRLIVRNNGHNGPATRGVIGDSYIFEQIDIDSSGYYSLVSNQSFTTLQSSLSLVSGTLYLASGSTFLAPNLTAISGAGGTLNIQVGATLLANAVTSLANVTLYNYSRIAFPGLASMSSLRFENYGIYNHSGSLLTINNSSTWVESGELSSIGDTQPITDIMVDNATLEFRNQNISKVAEFNSVEVRNAGILTHSAASATPSATLNLQVGSMTIQTGGKVDVTGRGYAAAAGGGAGQGPGGGNLDSTIWRMAGGNHAGIGGATGSLAQSQTTYGTISQPNTHGSSGGNSGNPTGAGGGVVKLTITGVLLNSGLITAAGGAATGSWSGGGAGGSIWLDVGTLQGSGTISADGGVGSGVGGWNAYGGGGGRVALYYTTNSFVGPIQAYGGGPTSFYGGAGTIYLKDKTETLGYVLIDNNSHSGSATIIPLGNSESFASIKSSNAALFKIVSPATFAADLLQAETSGIIEVTGFTSGSVGLPFDLHIKSGGLLRHSDNTTSQANIVKLALNNLTVDAGGIVDLSGYGYDPGYGPGASTGNSGAGYGGYGATGSTGVRGTNYGNMLVPVDFGSGAAGAGGAGGGMMRLQVNNTLTLNGQLKAMGANGGANSGGGSGGSILISALNLAGNGFITANGGNGTSPGAGGSGGRIAIYYFGQSFLPSGGHISSAVSGQYVNPVGGSGAATGADGTLYMSYPDHYTITGSSSQTAGTTQTITITLIDNLGNPFVWDGLRNIILSGATASSKGNPATCTDVLGNAVPFDSPLTVNFANGVGTCNMVLYKVGTHEIDLTDGIYNTTGNVAWDLDVTVNGSGSVTPSVLYSQLSADKQVASISETITATLTIYDAYGNRVTSGGSAVTMTVTGANAQVLTVTDNLNGTYTSSYVAANTGTDQIRATLSGGPVMDDTDGIPDGNFHVAVIPAPADHLQVFGQATQHTGSGQTITIRAKSASGITDSSYNGTKTITLSGPLSSPESFQPTCRDIFGVDKAFGQATSLEFANGEATCQMYLYKVEVAEVDVSDGVLNSFGNFAWDLDVTVTINPAASAQGRISASPSPAVDNDTIALLVQATDPYGNNWNKTGLSVSLQVSGGNTAIPAVSDEGNGTYSASYQAVNTGLDQIRGSVGLLVMIYDTDGSSDGTFNLSVLAGVVAQHFEVTGNANQVAGASQSITITAKGAAGQTSPSYRGVKTVTLSGGLVSLKGHVATCTDRNALAIALGSPMSLNFTNGVAQCNLVLYRAGAQSIDASDGSIDSTGDPDWDLDVLVSATVVDNASAHLSGSGTSVDTTDTVTATVYGRDQYGNNVSNGGATVAITVSGTNAQVLSVADQADGSYTGSYLARNAGVDQIRGTFNGVTIASDNDGVSDGVFNLTVNDTITATHLEVKGNGTQIAGRFQSITIQALDDGGYRDFGFSGVKSVKLSGANPTTSNAKPGCLDRQGAVKTFGTLTNLDFTNGQATCQMVLYKVETAHIDVESGSLNSYADPAYDLDVDVQAAGTGVASALIDARPNPVVVNGNVAVTITTLDEYGNQIYDGGSVMSGSISGANSRILTLADQADGTYTATYLASNSGVDNITGTVNSSAITADTDGISNGTYVVRVMSVGFADHLELSGANTQDVGSSQIITVAAKMLGGGTDSSYTGIHEITLSGANAAPVGTLPTCRDRNGVDRALGTATELVFTEGVATCRLYLYKAELAEIDASDTVISTVGDPAWDLDVTVGINPGGLAQGRIGGTVTTAIENELVGLTVQATDTYGNDWAKNGLSMALNVTGANTVVPVLTDNGDGTYSASYTASGVGNDLVRGTVNGQAILYDLEGTSDGLYHLTVLAGIVPHHFEVTGLGTQVAGSAQAITITARAVTGELAPSYRGDKNITLSGGILSLRNQNPTCTDKNGQAVNLGSVTTLAFNNGVASCNLVLFRTGDQSIDVTDGALSSAADPLWDLDVTVGVGALDNGSSYLMGSSTTINTKDTETVLVYARDAAWNNLLVGGASVALSVSGANARSLTVSDLGDGSYRASYVAQIPGTDAVRGTFNGVDIGYDNEGLSDGVYHLVVSDTIVADHLEVTGNNSQLSGTFQTIVISARDSAGYRAYSYHGVKTLKLSGANKSPSGFKPACLDMSGSIKPFGAATVLQFVNGQASCLMVLYQIELAHIDALDSGTILSSSGNDTWDLDVLVQANTGDNQGGVISAAPSPAQVGSTISVTVSISDSFGNTLSASGLDVALSVSGANPQTLTVVDNHDGTYSAQYIAAHHGVDFIDGTLNGEPITADTDGTSDGTYRLSILPLNSLLEVTPSLADKDEEVTVSVTVTGAGSGIAVTGLSVNITVDGANPGSLTASDLGAGHYRVKYLAKNEGVDFITGTVDAAQIKADADGVSDGVFQLPIVGNGGSGGSGRFIAGVAHYESSSGRPALGVEVTAGTNSAVTNQFGYYVIYDIGNGSYTLGGSKSGYSVYADSGVNPVVINDAPVVNANLIVSASVPVEVVAPWNSFLGHVVIAEIFNSGSEPLTAEVTLYRQTGSQGGAEPDKILVRVPVRQQRDIILNVMKNFKLDSYGVLRIRFSHPYYNGQVSYYKVRPGEVGFRENADVLKKEFDYALANPFVGPSYGKSYMMFNTHQPSGKAEDLEKLVPNWLTVASASTTRSEWFTIKKYDESGKFLSTSSLVGMPNCVLKSGAVRCKVPALGRIDVDGGHVFPGPGHAGLIEVIPDNPQAPYSANIVRYGMGAAPTVYTEKYDFAAYLQARAGSYKEQVMPISTVSGAENWLEIANVSSVKQTVTAEFYYYDGEFAGAQNFTLGARAQVHVNVEPIIGKGSSGVVKLAGQGSNGVIAHNMSYYRLDDRGVYVVTGTQSAEPNRARIAGTYNRFLNMSNWLRITNLTAQERRVTLKLHVSQNEQAYVYELPAYGGIDVPLHDGKYSIAKNTLGMFDVENDDPGAIFAQMYRMKHADTVPFDFVMPTEVR